MPGGNPELDHPNIARVFDGGATDVGARLSSAAARPSLRVGGNLSDPPIAIEAAAAEDSRAPIPAGRPYSVISLVRGLPITQYCDEVKMPA